jgi:hypothetical protein
MRVVFVCVIMLLGALLCIELGNDMKEITEKRQSQFCEVDPSYCK